MAGRGRTAEGRGRPWPTGGTAAPGPAPTLDPSPGGGTSVVWTCPVCGSSAMAALGHRTLCQRLPLLSPEGQAICGCQDSCRQGGGSTRAGGASPLLKQSSLRPASSASRTASFSRTPPALQRGPARSAADSTGKGPQAPGAPGSGEWEDGAGSMPQGHCEVTEVSH